jgi:hypothetical protein
VYINEVISVQKPKRNDQKNKKGCIREKPLQEHVDNPDYKKGKRRRL